MAFFNVGNDAIFECGRPYDPVNGKAHVYDDGLYVNYTCNPGYELIGAPFRMCTIWKTWNGREPLCSKFRIKRAKFMFVRSMLRSCDEFIAHCFPS